MFNAIIDWFDGHYSPVAIDGNPQPPAGTWNFVVYFVRQFKISLAVRMVTVALSALADAMLPIFVGLDRRHARDHPARRALSTRIGDRSALMLAVVLLRPLRFRRATRWCATTRSCPT